MIGIARLWETAYGTSIAQTEFGITLCEHRASMSGLCIVLDLSLLNAALSQIRSSQSLRTPVDGDFVR